MTTRIFDRELATDGQKNRFMVFSLSAILSIVIAYLNYVHQYTFCIILFHCMPFHT